jgi:hypothetical protein
MLFFLESINETKNYGSVIFVILNNLPRKEIIGTINNRLIVLLKVSIVHCSIYRVRTDTHC